MKNSGSTSRRAPLARESFDSRDASEMKDFRIYEKPRDLKLSSQSYSESHEFYDMTRKQQNLKMYKAIAPVIEKMFSEWSGLVATLKDVERRIEILQIHRDLDDQNKSFVAVSTIGETPNQHYYRDDYEVEGVDGCFQSKSKVETSGNRWYYNNRDNPDPSQPSSDLIEQHRVKYPKVIINVGGVRHEVMWRLFLKRPLTRLGMLAKARNHETIIQFVDSYSLDDNEIYFDRDPLVFTSILNYYRTDKLHCVDETCVLDFAAELEFWMISDINLEICCVEKFFARKDKTLEVVERERKNQPELEELEDFGVGYFARYQKQLWDLFEKPQSSLAAKIVSIVSVSLVLISTIGMCFNTFSWMQIKDINGQPVDNPKLALVEAVCISYFTIEFLMRLAGD